MFIEEYLKTRIIADFEDYALLHNREHLVHVRGGNSPILTWAVMEDTEDTVAKFELTNVGVINIDAEDRKINVYTISGIISTLNDGRIIITSYDKR